MQDYLANTFELEMYFRFLPLLFIYILLQEEGFDEADEEEIVSVSTKHKTYTIFWKWHFQHFFDIVFPIICKDAGCQHFIWRPCLDALCEGFESFVCDKIKIFIFISTFYDQNMPQIAES